MSFKNIKANQGFTIVELLIVVVVIAILAAITIVSYNGITKQANASAAASLAASVKKKAELFATGGPTNTYPRAFNDISGGAAIIGVTPSRTTGASDSWYVTGVSNGTPTADNGKKTVQYQTCGHNGTATAPLTVAAMTTIVGGRVQTFNYDSGSGVITIDVGSVTTGGSPNVTCINS